MRDDSRTRLSHGPAQALDGPRVGASTDATWTGPYNSLYVISDQGVVVTRYDERLLSNTKISYMTRRRSPGHLRCRWLPVRLCSRDGGSLS